MLLLLFIMTLLRIFLCMFAQEGRSVCVLTFQEFDID